MTHRLEHDLDQLSRFGALPDGGVSRLAFTREDLQARAWLKRQMEQAGLAVSMDAAGNIRGRRAGKRDLPPVMTGSHIDTVPQGGNYDGAVGVLAGLEVVRRLNDRNLVTRRPVEVICFAAEESSRFGMATLGSRGLTGSLLPEMLDSLVDHDGITLFQALQGAGGQAGTIGSAAVRSHQIHAFLEMHIEQGPVLESRNIPVGIVTSIAAPTRFKVLIEGRSDHSGSTPMNMRRDALAGAGELILGVERITGEEAGRSTVGTVGYSHVMPGSMNVVPGRVEVGIDIRDINREDKDAAVAAVKRLMGQIAEKRGLTVTCEQLCHDEPVVLSNKITTCLQEAACQAGLPFMLLSSGAGHDAMNMARITDAGMIFIPSAGGISHNINEFTHMNDIDAGTEVLLRAMIHLAEE